MSLRSVVAALVCVSLSACGHEPTAVDVYVGRITQIFIVKNVFENMPDDYTITVDSRTDHNGGCGETVSVHIGATTRLAWSDAPDVSVGPEEVHAALGKTARVSPGKDPQSTECKPRIEATSILFVR